MRIGYMVGEGSGDPPSVDSAIESAKRIESLGLHTAWVANVNLDGITVGAALGRETGRIEIGTAVVPTYPRHPFAMGQQAATAQAACGGRFALGIGLSHKVMIEGVMGMSFERPARHMREYLEALGPLLRGEPVDHQGESYAVHWPGFQYAAPTPLLIAALGPVMLDIAGSMTDGTITWATGQKTLEQHIGPRLRSAAEAAGRPEPRVVAGFPVLVTNDADAGRRKAGEIFQMYRDIPSYRAMMDREGVGGVEDLAIVGDEAEVEAQFRRLRDVGVTDLCVFPYEVEAGGKDRTEALLGSLC